MITIQTKKHDNFSVEFKFGFEGNSTEAGHHDFVVNSWIFVPNSLDINPQTYGKDQFYRDIKSNVRLITPVYLLRSLAESNSLPFATLRRALESLVSEQTPINEENYESQIKLFVAIFKSAIRNHSVHTAAAENVRDVCYLRSLYRALGLLLITIVHSIRLLMSQQWSQDSGTTTSLATR